MKTSCLAPSNIGFAAALAGAGLAAIAASEALGALAGPAARWVSAFLLLTVIALCVLRIYSKLACRTDQMVSLIRDLEETVETLRCDKLRADLVLSSTADGIIAVDADNRITLFNDAAARMFDDRDPRVIGQRLEDIDLHPEIARVAAECTSARRAMSSEVRLPGVQEKAVGIVATPFRTRCSGGDTAIVILRDLSELRRHEKSQKEFVGNVSHELRTPITAVKVTAEALLAGAKDDEDLLQRFLHTIISEADRLSSLIDDLMEIAKRDSGISKTAKAAVNVADVIERAVRVVRPQAQRDEVDVRVDVPDGLAGFCDEAQTIQLLRNLVDNAVKYTRPGGSVDIRARKMESDLVVTITDTGIGIPQGEVDRIFERFYRVDKARSRQLGGTGLGLAIVKEIVESHGGKISVETQLGKGSTFTVTIPGG